MGTVVFFVFIFFGVLFTSATILPSLYALGECHDGEVSVEAVADLGGSCNWRWHLDRWKERQNR